MTTAESAAQFRRQVQEVAARYPNRRSGVLEALRLAQERHGGWLPREAFEEVAAALDETPAYAKAIATFYDMFHLEPVGRHLVEVCTNLSCALAGAQGVVEAFERELGVQPGGTTEDGEITFRLMECAGGCGRATVVVVDHRYREHVQADDVASILEELRAGG